MFAICLGTNAAKMAIIYIGLSFMNDVSHVNPSIFNFKIFKKCIGDYDIRVFIV